VESTLPTPKPRLQRSPEFREMLRKMRKQNLDVSPEAVRERKRLRHHAIKLRRKKGREAKGYFDQPKKPRPTRHTHIVHNMTRDPHTKHWRVRVPREDGTIHYVSTGQTEVADAFRAVDATGVQRLSILARSKYALKDINAVTATAHQTPCANVFDAWGADLRLDVAPRTHACYVANIRQMLDRFECDMKPMSAITRQMLHDFVNDETIKYGSRSVRLVAIRSFYKHAAGFGHVIGNIGDLVKLNGRKLTIKQRQKKPALPFDEEEYYRIMGRSNIPKFWKWATALSYWLGLRLVDVCQLEVASLGDDFGVVYPSKTGRKLVIPLHDPLIGSGELKRVFAEIRAQVPEGQTYCFPEWRDKYLQNAAIPSMAFVSMLRMIHIKKKSFHGLRHSFKIRLMAAGKTIEEVAELMGHTDTEVTEGYGRAATG
jgi:integrase